MPTERSAAALLSALMRLRSDLDAAPLRLDLPEAEQARLARRETIDQLEDYVLPRLVQLDAPLLAVVGGSTGAGKSTLVNSIVGRPVTESGVLRPTTRSPVLVHHPSEAHWFAPERILPDLARTTTSTNDISALRLVSTKAVPAGLAILDAPDVDSVDVANRELAAQLLAAADLWLFVTSSARYADQVPWNFLQAAARRSAAVAVVLDRTPAVSLSEVQRHLARMMTSRGLKDSPLFTVPESPVDADGLLPPDSVATIRDWLQDLAVDTDVRDAIVTQTLDGAVRQIIFRAHDVADAANQESRALVHLHEAADVAYADQQAALSVALADGTVVRGALAARWQEFVGSGELVRSLEDRVTRIRDRFLDSVTGRKDRSGEVLAAVENAVDLTLLEHAERAAEATERAWSSTPPGRAVLAAHGGGLGKAPRDFRMRAERTVRDWLGAVLVMVREGVADKRMNAKVLALGVNGLAAALAVAVLTRQAGSQDDAGASGRRLLEAVLGAPEVDALLDRARDDLELRVGALVRSEHDRFGALLREFDSGGKAADNIREAARRAEDARHSDLMPDWDE
ncbi:ABC transporter [Solicola sp. PLA-1-18]|uniref:ABC transporter n=1 Tax=Solicola sp. PLA-1-18 TaxID=3380532 RepID=UPI003B7CD7BA